MYAFHESQFTDAAQDALLQAATQNVLGAFRGSADDLFRDVLAVLRSSLNCTSTGVRLLDARRLQDKQEAGEVPAPATLDELVARTVRAGRACISTLLQSGTEPLLSFVAAPLSDRAGAVTGCLFAIAPAGQEFGPDDVEAISRFARIGSREFDLIAATYTDPATGAMSQWAFDALIHEESGDRIVDARSVAAIGIDGLDGIVEVHGRRTSELVLRSVAQVCRETLRRTDLIARLGSPRLVALLSDASPQVTLQCMDRVRTAVEKLTFLDLPVVRISLSIGYMGPGSGNLSKCVADAEKASYAAARMGGNRCLSVEELRAALRVFKDRQT